MDIADTQRAPPMTVKHSSGHKHTRPNIKPLRFGDIFKGDEAIRDAFVGDPMHAYLKVSSDAKTSWTTSKLSRVWNSLWLIMVTPRIPLTINHGESVIVIDPAVHSVSRFSRWFSMFAFGIIMPFFKVSSMFMYSAEQKKRRAELAEKVTAVAKNAFGDKVKDMIYISMLATSPKCQGRGYGRILLQTACDMADRQGREAYLNSSKEENIAFYSSHGFHVVGKAILGDDNPNYTGPRITVPVMVRKPKSASVDSRKLS